MSISVNKSVILNKIKEHYSFSSDAEFARYLDIKPQTLASWHSRNTYDIELLYAKCVDFDGNWLIDGQGNMLKTKSAYKSSETPIQSVSDNFSEYTKKDNCIRCEDKNKLINQQEVTIDVLRQSIAIMKDRIDDLESERKKTKSA